MNNSLKPLLSLSLAAALAFGLTGCTNKAEPAPSPTPSATSTAKPSAAPTSSATPTQSPSASESVPPAQALNELEEAQKAFPDVKAEGNFSKEDIQLAAFGASRYTNTVYNSGYLANGSWVKNGADSQQLVKLFGKDWSDSYRQKIEQLVARTQTGTDEEKNTAAKELLVHFFFFDNTKLTLPDDCSDNNVGADSCLVDGKLVSDKEITYQVNHDTGSIYVNETFTANVKFVKDGVQGVTPVHYDVQLEMIKNPYPDAENLRYTYIVNDLGGTWKFENWREGEK